MDEQYLVLAAQASILGSIAVIVAIYMMVAILNLLAVIYERLLAYIYVSVYRTQGLGEIKELTKVSHMKNNTKVAGV